MLQKLELLVVAYNDKILHFFVGYSAAHLSGNVVAAMTGSSFYFGSMLVAVIIGATKEYLYDVRAKGDKFCKLDFACTVAGGIIGASISAI